MASRCPTRRASCSGLSWRSEGGSVESVSTECETLSFALLTISCAARWAFAAVLGLWACFDAVAGLRLLIWYSKDDWSPPKVVGPTTTCRAVQRSGSSSPTRIRTSHCSLVPRCISELSKVLIEGTWRWGTRSRLLAGCWVELLPRPSWPKRTFSASSRTEAAWSLRIFRYTPSASMDYFISRSSSHKACSSFESRTYFFADHQYSFATPLLPPRISFIIRTTRFECQQRQRLSSSSTSPIVRTSSGR
jgi:hypothetical protein